MIISQYVQLVVISLFGCLISINTSNAEQTVHKIAPQIIRVFVRTQGTVTIRLTHEKQFAVDTHAKFYQGEITLRSGTYPVAATQIGNDMRVVFPGKVTGSRKSRQRIFTIKSRDSFNNTRVSSMPRSAHPDKACATESHEQDATSRVNAINEGESTTVKIITVSTTADAEWAATFGSTANAEIASIINTAEALYERQLGIRFQIVSQTIQTSSTPEIGASDILNTFRLTTPVTADAQYLFTTKDMTGATIGVAYIGTICYAPKFAFGVVQQYSTLTASVFAHEMGHSLGAQHDFSGYGSLMYPSISFGTPYFSAASLGEINVFLSYFGSCLKTEQTLPAIATASMSVRRSGRVFTITILDKSGNPMANEPVSVVVNGKITRKKTNMFGKVSIVLKQKRGTKIRLVVQSNNNTTLQKTIVFKIQ